MLIHPNDYILFTRTTLLVKYSTGSFPITNIQRNYSPRDTQSDHDRMETLPLQALISSEAIHEMRSAWRPHQNGRHIHAASPRIQLNKARGESLSAIIMPAADSGRLGGAKALLIGGAMGSTYRLVKFKLTKRMRSANFHCEEAYIPRDRRCKCAVIQNKMHHITSYLCSSSPLSGRWNLHISTALARCELETYIFILSLSNLEHLDDIFLSIDT